MWAAGWVIAAVLMLSNSATPLYVHWQSEMGFPTGMLAVIFAAYIAGMLLTLAIAGQLSDRFGRRSVLLPGVCSAMAGCVLFAFSDTVGMLLVARLMAGVAVGVVVSAGMAAVLDLGGPTAQRKASLVASVAIVIGAGVGPLLAGALAQAMRDPVLPIFSIEFVLLATAAIVVAVLPVGRHAASPGRGWRMTLPSVPSSNRRHLAIGTGVFAPAITVTAFILSLGPSLLSHILGVNSPLIAGGMGGAIFFSATAAQFAVQRLSVKRILLIGTAGTLSAVLLLAIAVQMSSANALIVAAVLGGSGLGLGQLGGLTLIGLHVPRERRAEAGAILNIGGYLAAGILPIATGFLIDSVGIAQGTFSFAMVLALAAMLGAVQVVKRIRIDSGGDTSCCR